MATGDLFFFVFALWLTLYLRTFEAPTGDIFLAHLVPFLFLFAAWMVVFLISGLYERQLIARERDTAALILNVQSVNVIIAALFFFLIPVFGLAPKTILFIYLIVSFFLIFFWRTSLLPLVVGKERSSALILGEGEELEELARTLTTHPHARVKVEVICSPRNLSPEECARKVEEKVLEKKPDIFIVHFEHPTVLAAMGSLYKHLFSGIRFIDAVDAYEEVFGRVPLSLIGERWIARNISRYAHRMYDSLKRALDVFAGLIGFILSLPFYPLIALAITLEDGGPVFIKQVRVGEGNVLVELYKFRSMERNETDLQNGRAENRVTRVGAVLRATRLDELPQLIGVMRGDLSLIGPRPELPSGVVLYEREILFYGLRHLIKPGLSGWAQVYHHGDPHHAADIEATKEKLSYDLYYLKHRSFTLDLVIGLKTIRKLIAQRGS